MRRNIFLRVFVGIILIAGSLFVEDVTAQRRVVSRKVAPDTVVAPDTTQITPGHPIRVDDFQYSTGQLTDSTGGANVSGGNWITNTGTGSFIQVTAGSLSYTGYPSSGIGNKIDIVSVATSAEDTFRNFPTQTAGTTYAAFMVNVANTTGLAANSSTTGDYFAGFISSTSTTAFVNRVTIRAGSVAGTYQLGLRATGNAGNVQAFSLTDLPVGTTALVVISYQIVAGATNDVCNMWVNPVITGPEPAPTLTQVSASDNNDVGRFFVRQGNAGTPNASLDGVRVGTSWASLIASYLSPAPVDFNGDGKTDYSIYRVSAGAGGHQLRWFSTYNGVAGDTETAWGLDTDAVTPGDFDGDGKDDVAVWRGASGGNSAFYIIQSATVTVRFVQFGLEGDDPYMIADYDGDGKDDVAIYRPGATAGAQSTFWWMPSDSGSPLANHPVPISWGAGPEDGSADFPVPGDFNGDGKADFCIYRNNGSGGAQFWLHPGSGGVDANAPTTITYFGQFSDTVVPGDYDGDGKTDIAVVRDEGGNLVWYIRPSSGVVPAGNPYPDFIRQPWGLQSSQFNPDYPVQGDYDGDGKTDIAVWRDIGDNSAGDHFFYILGSQSGVIYKRYGQAGDIPTALDTH